jgi:D-alanyl-D-alanine carboxypeptidase
MSGMMKRAKGQAKLLLCVLLVASVVLACSSCGTPSFSSEKEKRMESIVEKAMAALSIPGVIVGIWTPEGVWVKAFGKADIETAASMKEGDRVRIASNTKTFVATVLLQLASEGKLLLDDTLDKYVPSVKDAGGMTLRQVLNMTSGTFSFTEDEQFGEQFEKDPLMKLTPEQEIEIANRHDNYFPPGGGYHYSDTNYEVAGLVIEKVTGNKLEDEVQARIIEPLSLSDTSFPETPDMAGQHSKGYVLENGKLADYTRVEPSVPWAGGAMISNLNDMKAWAEALAGGSLLDSRMHAEQMKTVKTGTGATEYGLGVLEIDGFWGHTGAIFGYSSIFLRDPERDATFVVFANKATNDSSEAPGIALELMKLLYPDFGSK